MVAFMVIIVTVMPASVGVSFFITKTFLPNKNSVAACHSHYSKVSQEVYLMSCAFINPFNTDYDFTTNFLN